MKLDFSDEKPSSSNVEKIKKQESPKGKIKSPEKNATKTNDLNVSSNSLKTYMDLDKGQENNLNITNWDSSFGDEWHEEMVIPVSKTSNSIFLI